MKIYALLTAAALGAVAQTGCGSTPPAPSPPPAPTPTPTPPAPSDLDLPTGEPRALPHETCERFSNGWDRHRCKMFWGLERS